MSFEEEQPSLNVPINEMYTLYKNVNVRGTLQVGQQGPGFPPLQPLAIDADNYLCIGTAGSGITSLNVGTNLVATENPITSGNQTISTSLAPVFSSVTSGSISTGALSSTSISTSGTASFANVILTDIGAGSGNTEYLTLNTSTNEIQYQSGGGGGGGSTSQCYVISNGSNGSASVPEWEVEWNQTIITNDSFAITDGSDYPWAWITFPQNNLTYWITISGYVESTIPTEYFVNTWNGTHSIILQTMPCATTTSNGYASLNTSFLYTNNSSETINLYVVQQTNTNATTIFLGVAIEEVPISGGSGGGSGTVTQVLAGSNATISNTNPNQTTYTVGVNTSPSWASATIGALSSTSISTSGTASFGSTVTCGALSSTSISTSGTASFGSTVTCPTLSATAASISGTASVGSAFTCGALSSTSINTSGTASFGSTVTCPTLSATAASISGTFVCSGLSSVSNTNYLNLNTSTGVVSYSVPSGGSYTPQLFIASNNSGSQSLPYTANAISFGTVIYNSFTSPFTNNTTYFTNSDTVSHIYFISVSGRMNSSDGSVALWIAAGTSGSTTALGGYVTGVDSTNATNGLGIGTTAYINVASSSSFNITVWPLLWL